MKFCFAALHICYAMLVKICLQPILTLTSSCGVSWLSLFQIVYWFDFRSYEALFSYMVIMKYEKSIY